MSGFEGKPKNESSERRLSEAEIVDLGDRLDPLWNEYFLTIQENLLASADRLRELGGDLFEGMSDRQVLALAPLALQAQMNPFSNPRTMEAFVQLLESKGMTREDAESSMENISLIAAAGIGSQFTVMGKVLHNMNDEEDEGE